jgi:hypothetical protein
VLAHAAPPETSKTRWKPPNFYLTSSEHTHTHTYRARKSDTQHREKRCAKNIFGKRNPQRQNGKRYVLTLFHLEIYIRWQECNKVIQMLRERVHPNTTEERERERPLQCKRKNAKSTAMSTSNRSHIQHSREREREREG